MDFAMPRAATITTPSRLHFGLFSFGRNGGPNYGGVGAMIDRPGVELIVRESSGCTATGPHAARAVCIARRVHKALGHNGETNCSIEIVRAAPLHVGLGTGTQLALAIAAGMAAANDVDSPTAEQLAGWTGRGRRSAVGAHGFAIGGMIVEEGTRRGQTLSPLVERLAIPDAWRFVLLRPRGEQGISGEAEEAAFAALSGPDHRQSAAARDEVRGRLVPAVRAGDFAAAAESLHRFGKHAGEIFSAWQGGVYASECLAKLAEFLYRAGYRGVGQSSWGPTLFVLVENIERAEECLALLRNRDHAAELELDIGAPSNEGARIEVASCR